MLIGTVAAGLLFTASGLVPPLFVRQILIWHAEGATADNAMLVVVAALVGAYLVRAAARYTYGLLSHWAAYNVQQAMMVTSTATFRPCPTASSPTGAWAPWFRVPWATWKRSRTSSPTASPKPS